VINISKILGNVESVRESILQYMEGFLGKTFSQDEIMPPEVVEMMVNVTLIVNREVAVYLDRKCKIISISLGDDRSVSLPEIEGRKNENRLSGIRLLHTHPNGSTMPSDIDINSLKTLRLDCMGVIAVAPRAADSVIDYPQTKAFSEEEIQFCADEKIMKYVVGGSVSVLVRDLLGKLTKTEIIGPYNRINFKRFNEVFDYISDIDKSVPEISLDIENGPENAIIAGVVLDNNKSIGDPLAELRDLALSAGAIVVGEMIQKRESPDSKFYIGKGLADELALKRQALNANLVIFDDELSPSQIKNLEEVIGSRVIDRTSLILDIFAKRANSSEGRLQVELAQQKYRLPRLIGLGTELSRLGGGIGTRGPGESKLTSDREHIKRRIHYLEKQLNEVTARRNILRQERNKKEVPVIAIVGYTNAGKSTLMNALCDSDVFVENKLFATLDPTVRRLVTPEKKDFLLVDTVGFIKKLPHDLVDAFKSTLEESVYADLLLHVVDADCPDLSERIMIVEKILQDIGADLRPRYLVINKIDKLEKGSMDYTREGYEKIFYISAIDGIGLEELRSSITDFFAHKDRKFTIVVPYTEGWVIPYIHEKGAIFSEEYEENGIVVSGKIPEEFFHRINGFVRS